MRGYHLLATGAVAQTTVVESHGRAQAGAVEKIVVGSPVPRDVELEAVPEDWGPSLTIYRYIYSGDHMMLVDPETRNVIEEVE